MKVVKSRYYDQVELVNSEFVPLCYAPYLEARDCGIRPGLEFTELEFKSRLARYRALRQAGYCREDAEEIMYQEFDAVK